MPVMARTEKKKNFKQRQIGRGKQMELGEELDVGWR